MNLHSNTNSNNPKLEETLDKHNSHNSLRQYSVSGCPYVTIRSWSSTRSWRYFTLFSTILPFYCCSFLFRNGLWILPRSYRCWRMIWRFWLWLGTIWRGLTRKWSTLWIRWLSWMWCASGRLSWSGSLGLSPNIPISSSPTYFPYPSSSFFFKSSRCQYWYWFFIRNRFHLQINN